MADNQLAVVGDNQVVVNAEVVEKFGEKSARSRAMIIATVPGLVDDPTKGLASVIKAHLKSKGLKPKDVTAEYLRIMREDAFAFTIAKMEHAKANGYTLEYRQKKDTKDGQEKFSVDFIPPAVAKRLTQSEQDKLFASLGGKDSAIGKQVWDKLEKDGMLAKPKTVEVKAEVVTQS